MTVGPNPSIRFLRIERFRGIEKLEWRPAPGLNVIIGPGDSCKSTILEAIGALFSPAPNMNISEFDYFRRDIDKGFEIEAALAVGDGSILNNDRFPLPPLRGWRDGQLTDLPDEGGAEAVMVCRLTGTADQEAIYEVIGADDETRVPLSRALRQRIGLMRLGITDRWDRDLRLVQGGALDRYMEGQHLRQSILQAILNTPIHDRLGDEPKQALGRIDRQFSKRSLPSPVRLGLVGTPGVSLAASVGLMVGENDESALPLPACAMRLPA
jgi:putative ATP-dependent endonuclease of OLD family